MKVRKRMVAHIKSKVVVVGGGGATFISLVNIWRSKPLLQQKKLKKVLKWKKSLIPKQESNSRPSIYPMDV